MDTFRPHNEKTWNARSITGTILTVSGAVLFIDRYLKTGWLSLLVLPSVGIFLFVIGARSHHARLIIAGAIFGSIGMGIAATLNPLNPSQAVTNQIGLLAMFFAFGWGIIAVSVPHFTNKAAWWALIPAGTLAGFGAALLYSPMRWVDFVYLVCLGTGIAILAWGILSRLLGLLIAGSLITSIGAGIYFAWGERTDANTLMQTGIMLVWFALGWLLITVGARFIQQKYLWWPLIPGGILAMVGFGLYIGGDPGNALGFISNTGAIVMMIFGFYLLLMRKGIHHD